MNDRFSKFLLVPVLLIALFFSCRVAAKAMPGDAILGMWEVKNEYYTAVYEIIRDQNQYFGKVHYYNDGDTVIIARKNKNDYMLEGVYYKDSTYTKGGIAWS